MKKKRQTARFFRQLGTLFLDLIAPPTCLHCGMGISDGVFCATCRIKWETEKQMPCRRCHFPQSRCQCMPSFLQTTFSGMFHLATYQAGTQSLCKQLILTAKEQMSERLLAFLATEMVTCVAESGIFPDLVTYAPRSRRARRMAGYDQSARLAKRVAQLLEVPFASTILRRGGGAPQKSLTASERMLSAAVHEQINPKQVQAVQGKTVLLLDDVLTTGATLGTCGALLLANGALRVYGITIGKTETDG